MILMMPQSTTQRLEQPQYETSQHLKKSHTCTRGGQASTDESLPEVDVIPYLVVQRRAENGVLFTICSGLISPETAAVLAHVDARTDLWNAMCCKQIAMCYQVIASSGSCYTLECFTLIFGWDER